MRKTTTLMAWGCAIALAAGVVWFPVSHALAEDEIAAGQSEEWLTWETDGLLEVEQEASVDGGEGQSEEAGEPSVGECVDDFVIEIPRTQIGEIYGDGTSDDSDELLDAYLDMRIQETLPQAGDPQLFAQSVSSKLTGRDALVFDYVKAEIDKIAAGTRTSTKIEIPLDVVSDKTSWTAAELGVDNLIVNGAINPFALSKVDELMEVDFYAIHRALLADYPYELYWHDKTAVTRYTPFQGYGCKYDRTAKEYVLYVSGNPYIWLPVIDAYASEAYQVKSPVGTNVSKAFDNAAKIVSDNASKTPYDRLVAYRDAICNMVGYDYAAAEGSDSYGDPWQLISVFDGNASTNVVCEGYAKAFKYLCDLSDFSDIECRIAEGVMGGGTGAGAHMWNVVQMPGGKNYLVDVTNCDAGSIGSPDKLFLKGYSSGSVTGGYVFAKAGNITYRYDSEMFDLYTTEELTLSGSDYAGTGQSGNQAVSLSGANVTLSASSYTYNGKARVPTPTVKLSGKTLAAGTDYTVSYANNVNAGTATVTITGKGAYTGSKKATFTIAKAAQTIVAKDMSVTYGTVASIGATAPGTLSYASANTGIAKVSSTGMVTPTAPGNVKITIKAAATGNYKAATKSIEVTVNAASLAGAMVSFSPISLAYTGKALTPAPTVKLGDKTLVAGTDYTVTYANNINAGTAKVTITGAGVYQGTTTGTFTIVKASQKVTAPSSLTLVEGEKSTIEASATTALSYSSNNTKVATVNSTGEVTGVAQGSTTIVVKAKETANYKAASKTVAVTVNPAKVSLAKAVLALPAESYAYTGKAVTPDVVVTLGNTELIKGTDYTVSYANNTKAGTATVTATGICKYTGTAKTTFTISVVKPTWSGATSMPVSSTATYAVENGSIRVKSGGAYVGVSGTTVTAKKAGSAVLALYDASGKQVATRKVSVYNLSGQYVLQSALASNLVLDISGASKKNGAKMIVWTKNGGKNQKYQFVAQRDGTYGIKCVHSGLYVDVSGGGKNQGANVIQWKWNGGANQRWYIMVDAGNRLTFKSKNSGLVFDINGGRAIKGKNMIQWAFKNGNNQKWLLKR